MVKIAKGCGVCDALLKVCGRLGDKSYCKRTLKELEDDEITETQFDRKIKNHFGAKEFNKEWEEELGK